MRRTNAAFASQNRPPRVSLAFAVLLGLLLVSAGLYLWRRPPNAARTTSSDANEAGGSSAALSDAGVVSGAVEASAPPPIVLADVRVLGCHDRGPVRTPSEQCDHLAVIEQAFSRAVEQSLPCVPAGSSGATIEYVADVSFLRRRVRISLPRAGRSIRDRKIVLACATAVRSALEALALDGVEHQHARYQISVTATYRGKS